MQAPGLQAKSYTSTFDPSTASASGGAPPAPPCMLCARRRVRSAMRPPRPGASGRGRVSRTATLAAGIRAHHRRWHPEPLLDDACAVLLVSPFWRQVANNRLLDWMVVQAAGTVPPNPHREHPAGALRRRPAGSTKHSAGPASTPRRPRSSRGWERPATLPDRPSGTRSTQSPPWQRGSASRRWTRSPRGAGATLPAEPARHGRTRAQLLVRAVPASRSRRRQNRNNRLNLTTKPRLRRSQPRSGRKPPVTSRSSV